MLKLPAILFVLFFYLSSSAQSSIKGIVVNETTGAPVTGSSVFISNSSIGTVTDSKGEFSIVNVPAGKHELVISCIGYETNVFAFTDKDLPLQLRVKMSIKVQQLENVVVEPYLEEGWDKWGKTFTENFIGTNENAKHCRIKNTGKIRFRYYKKSNRVIAYCDEPILIDNNALGYTIKYQLEEFEVSFRAGTTFYLGYPLFQDKTKEGKSTKNKWAKNREEAFKGSVVHFMQALYANKLAEEQFEVRRMFRSPNYEKERVKKIYLPSMATRKPAGDKIVIEIGNKSIGGAGDSADYYRRIMQQKDYVENYARELLTADSLIVSSDNQYKGIYFEQFISVTYKGETEELGYLQSIMQANRTPTFQRSLVSLTDPEMITFDKNGSYYDPMNFMTSGYWGWSEKTANLLPTDYKRNK